MNIQIRTTFTDTQERKNRKEKGANGFILKEDKNGVHHKKKKRKKRNSQDHIMKSWTWIPIHIDQT